MQTSKPPWLKIKPAATNSPEMQTFGTLRKRVKDLKLHTVCEESHCPNMAECWGMGTATFMVLGDTCTRGCKFCNIKTGNPFKKINLNEPRDLAKAVAEMKINYAVITSVDRDDLADGGAGHFAKCIETVRQECPDTLIELLIPDFRGQTADLDTIIAAKPKVIGQNIETVERLTHQVRDLRAGYQQTMDVLQYIKSQDPKIFTKSAIMVGLGETEEEVIQTLRDLRDHQVDFVNIGQYLQPSAKHYPLKEYVAPDQFKKYENIALEMGFLYAFCGPLVRSSYRAGEYFSKAHNF